MPDVNGRKTVVDGINYATVWVIVVVLIAAAVVDIYQTMYHGSGSSISATVWGLSKDYPVLPFLIGLLCGHLLWPQGK